MVIGVLIGAVWYGTRLGFYVGLLMGLLWISEFSRLKAIYEDEE